MTWYRTGTVAVTNGNSTVTGSGTAFVANVDVGEGFRGPDGQIYEITDVVSNTELTLARNYNGSTASGQAYAIAPFRGRIADLLSETATLLLDFAAVRDGPGEGLFALGSASEPGISAASDPDTGLFFPAANALAVATGGAERARVTNSGVAIGLTTGLEGSLTMADYLMIRRNTDGWLLKHERTDDTQLSGIKSVGHSSAVGLSFVTNDTERLRLELAGTFRAATDNTQSLGSASFRWSTVFAGTGTINTSDEREKEWRGPLNAAELAAAKRIANEIGIFRFLSSIAEKGDAARLHCGVPAQTVFAILDDEGLDWRDYAWCCFDEWDLQTDPGEDGEPEVLIEAGSRYGIRSDQLALWLIAAQEQRIAALEAAS